MARAARPWGWAASLWWLSYSPLPYFFSLLGYQIGYHLGN
jgi:hypothetical protein